MDRHFPSKEALYRAVLRQTIREQDENHPVIRLTEVSARGLVQVLRSYFAIAASDELARIKEGFRLLLASLARHGSFASLVYRRAIRMSLGPTLCGRPRQDRTRRDGSVCGDWVSAMR